MKSGNEMQKIHSGMQACRDRIGTRDVPVVVDHTDLTGGGLKRGNCRNA